VSNGGNIFRLNVGDVLENWYDLFTYRSGSVSVALQQGIRAGDVEAGSEESPFVFDEEQPVPGGIEILGDSEEHASARAPWPLSELTGWTEIIRATATATPVWLEIEVTSGRDTLTTRFPWTFFELQGSEPEGSPPDVEVMVNTVARTIPFETVWLASRSIIESGVLPEHLDVNGLEDLVDLFENRIRFAENYAGLSAVVATLLDRMMQENKMGCFLSCAGCSVALLAYGLDIAALILSCATLNPICLLAIIGHEAAAASVLASCSGCFICLKNRKKPRGIETQKPELPNQILP
jgi:hypothetical protein